MGGSLLSLVVGVLVPFFFDGLAQGQDAVIFLIVLAMFAACIAYGEAYLSLPNGLAFGFGMMLASFAAQNLPLGVLAFFAMVANLASYAWRARNDNGLEVGESPLFQPDPLVG